MLIARFDGGCWPNPGGHAACACLIERNGVEVYRKSRYLGFGQGMTNNVAEFEGVLLILEWLKIHPQVCTVIGDSQVVINRMRSRSLHCGTGTCVETVVKCKLTAAELRCIVRYEWQRRFQNEECDAMCDLEIEEAKAEIRKRMS